MRNTATIVRVMRALDPDGNELPALIYEKGKSHGVSQYLTPDTRASMGDSITGHFEAEKIAGTYWIGARIPHHLPW